MILKKLLLEVILGISQILSGIFFKELRFQKMNNDGNTKLENILRTQVALKHVIHNIETRTLVMELCRRAIKRWVRAPVVTWVAG